MNNPTPQKKKEEFRVWRLDGARWAWENKPKAQGPHLDPNEQVKVVEYSALAEANERIKRLKENIEKVYKGDFLDEDIHLEIFGE